MGRGPGRAVPEGLVTAAIDGARVGSVHDTTFAAGQVGLGVAGYQTDEFDNLSVA